MRTVTCCSSWWPRKMYHNLLLRRARRKRDLKIKTHHRSRRLTKHTAKSSPTRRPRTSSTLHCPDGSQGGGEVEALAHGTRPPHPPDPRRRGRPQAEARGRCLLLRPPHPQPPLQLGPRKNPRRPTAPRNGPVRWRRAARAPTSPSCSNRRGPNLAMRGVPARLAFSLRHLASTFMLEAKGEGILSWCEDDNYILDDDLAPDFEVPFLSMDLLSLATQLSKLKLSQRLFIEEDLLPEDLATASEDNQTPTQHDTSLESDGKDTLVEDNFKEVEPKKKAISHDNTSNIHFDDQMKTGTVPSPGYSVDSKLEVVAAEEELDMLLDSLSGIHLPSSNFDDSYGNNSTLDSMKISESNEKATSSTSKSLELAPLDDALDVLLSETSLSVQNDGFAVSSSSCRPTFDSDDNIDFRYAKQIDVTTSIDDSVDNFLADTSLCLNDQKETTSELGQPNISNVSVPSHSGPSNVSADFDSWFDSL